jgi:hypothetical protein
MLFCSFTFQVAIQRFEENAIFRSSARMAALSCRVPASRMV